MKIPREYQQRAWDRFKDALFFCLNFACGLGKTFVFAWIAITSDKPTLIIAPKRLCKQWEQELIDAGVDPRDIFVADKPLEAKDPKKYKERFEAFMAR
jgi:superfamily II DNA or RNA helicase